MSEQRLGEFPIPPSGKDVAPSGVNILEELDTPGMDTENLFPIAEPEVQITDENRERFLESILSETPYTEELELLGGKLKIVLRTRELSETDTVVKAVKDSAPEAAIDVELIMGKANLAYALVSQETEKSKEVFDKPGISLAERLERIQRFPTPKYTALVSLLSKFDRKVYELSEEAAKPDFLQTEGAA